VSHSCILLKPLDGRRRPFARCSREVPSRQEPRSSTGRGDLGIGTPCWQRCRLLPNYFGRCYYKPTCDKFHRCTACPLFASADNRWPHMALWCHWLMPFSCHFRVEMTGNGCLPSNFLPFPCYLFLFSYHSRGRIPIPSHSHPLYLDVYYVVIMLLTIFGTL